jgi:hypothetical protein
MNKIDQVNVAEHGRNFKNDLIYRYKFKDYYDINKPCFFFGGIGEIDKINKHQGLKIVQFITPSDCEHADRLIPSDNLFLIDDPNIDKRLSVKRKNVLMEFKDFSNFIPNLMGNKIYCYMRDKNEFQYSKLQNIQDKINYEIVYGGISEFQSTPPEYYLPINDIKKHYDDCFLSINLSGRHGFLTMRELSMMGRKTIMNSIYNFPSIIRYNNEDDIISIINEESKKINTIQPRINPHNVGDEWLNIEFWN